MYNYGLKWRSWEKGILVTKERWFKSDEERRKFAERESDKNAFVEWVVWYDNERVH